MAQYKHMQGAVGKWNNPDHNIITSPLKNTKKQLKRKGTRTFIKGEVGESGMTASAGPRLKADLYTWGDFDAPEQQTTFSKLDRKGRVKKTTTYKTSELDDDWKYDVSKETKRIKRKDRTKYQSIEDL